MYISPGENLTCCAVGPPSPKVTWIRHNKELSSATGCATVQRSTLSDEGAYLCRAENQLGTDEKQVIVMFSKFRFVSRPPENLYLKAGQRVDVRCSAAIGRTSARISWSRPKCLSCSSQYAPSARVLGDGTLQLVSAKTWDSGVYYCIATAGGVIQRARVEINVGNQPTGKLY